MAAQLRKKVYSLQDMMALPPEEQDVLFGAEDAALSQLYARAGTTQVTPYTKEDIRALRAHLRSYVGTEGLNPLDRSEERRQRLRTAVTLWLRMPSNHGGRLGYSEELVEKLVGDAVGLGVVEQLLDRPEITQITVSAWNQIAVEQRGRVLRLEPGDGFTFESRTDLLARIESFASWAGKVLSRKNPQATWETDDGARITVQVPPASESGLLVIRRRSPKIYDLDEMVRLDSLTQRMADLLRQFIRAGVGIAISGPSGGGKTTILEGLCGEIPPSQIVTLIQETLEIRREAFKCTVSYVKADPDAKPGEGTSLSKLADGARLVGSDRVITGEVKGRETSDMLNAAAGGAAGCMCTLHAKRARSAPETLVGYVLKDPAYQQSGAGAVDGVRRRIADFFPIVIHMAKAVGSGYTLRFVAEIVEVEVDKDGEWKFKTVASGRPVGGEVVWEDVPDRVEHIPAVAYALEAMPAEDVEEPVAEELFVTKRTKALDRMSRAEQAAEIKDWKGALSFLDEAAELSPDNSVIITTRSQMEARMRQERASWVDKLDSIEVQVRLRMEFEDEDGVRRLIPAIEAVDVVIERRNALLEEVHRWIGKWTQRWEAIPTNHRDAVREVLTKGDVPLSIAWGELFYRVPQDDAARFVFEQVRKMQPGDAGVQEYLVLLGGHPDAELNGLE